MASNSLARILTQRKAGPIEFERDHFEKCQTTSISKAINNQETPVKEKHVRSAIIGTYHVKGATLFWSVVSNLPIQGNHIACWKMCHTLHKVLREGHPLVILDSQMHKSKLRELGKYWGHLRDSFGNLISHYCFLLAIKLDFHSRIIVTPLKPVEKTESHEILTIIKKLLNWKNPKFPGNMQVTDEQLDNIVELDINNFFQLSVEMFDYMEEILNLQAAVFGSLESGRANSMTTSGQCRLSPLIPCIQDSSHLYDYLVKLLFKLHSSLSEDVLLGHRERFYKQYKILHNFYQLARNLQYFKQLIQIPPLPDDPPNFLKLSDLGSHVSPIVVLPSHPETLDTDSIDMSLVERSDSDLLDVNSSNGSSSPELISDKDRIIERLMQEIDYLKLELQRIKNEGQHLVDEKQLTVTGLELQLDERTRQLQTMNQEVERLHTKEEEMPAIFEVAGKLVESEKKAKVSEEKFSKMKDVYSKLRDEHVTLIRMKADVDKQLGSLRQSGQDVEKNKYELEEKISSLVSERNMLQSMVENLQSDVSALEEEIRSSSTALQELQKAHLYELNHRGFSLLVGSIEEAESVVNSAMGELDNPSLASFTCTPECCMNTFVSLNTVFERFKENVDTFEKDKSDWEGLLKPISGLSHFLSLFLIQGKAISNATPDIEEGDRLVNVCRNLGVDSLCFLSSLKSRVSIGVNYMEADLNLAKDVIDGLLTNAIPKIGLQIGDMVEQELMDMDRVVEEATSRIVDILNKSREADTGLKFEVNEKILDACTLLMQTIKVLVQKSKDLQLEIVAQGKGKASVKEFYKRNHRWTEGLISAAKAVGLGARLLVDAADKVVNGDAKLEELMVASQEIAASTAQLVVASKVKADINSQNLRCLSLASKDVSHATGNVVATVRSCSQMMDDSDIMDFTKLTLHQAKRLEMDSQVKVLELESNLVKERQKLASLRKQHYMLGGAGEGWDQQVN